MKKKIAVVYSDYYPEITQNLITAFETELNSNFDLEKIEVFGVSEIPFVVSRLDVDKYSAVAVFGCVLEGETYHHELINKFVFDSLYNLSIEKSLPLGYAILNVRNFEQAKERSRLASEVNRGYEAAQAILKLI